MFSLSHAFDHFCFFLPSRSSSEVRKHTSLHVKNIRKFSLDQISSHHALFQLLRIQSPEGTKRVEFTAQDTNKIIYEKVRISLPLNSHPHISFRLLKHSPYHPSMILRYTKRKTSNLPLFEQQRK